MNQSAKWRNVVSLVLSSAPLGIMRKPALCCCSTIAIVIHALLLTDCKNPPVEH